MQDRGFTGFNAHNNLLIQSFIVANPVLRSRITRDCAMQKNKKAAPYSRAIINHPNKSEIIICTGKIGWNRAKSTTWFSRIPKTILPYQDDPAAYKWPVQNRVVMVFDFDPELEGFDRLLLLSKQLLIDGAAWVLLMSESFPMARIERESA